MPSASAEWSEPWSLVVGQAIDDYVQNIMSILAVFCPATNTGQEEGHVPSVVPCPIQIGSDSFCQVCVSGPQLQEALPPTAITFRRLPSDTGGLRRGTES